MRKHLGWILLVFLSLIWGSSFILMKRGLLAFTPLQVGALRMLISSTALLPFLILRPISFRKITLRTWIGLAVVGFCGNGIPAFLFPMAETQLNSATAGILNALTPMFTLIIGVLFFTLPFTRRMVWGLALGLIGSILLVALGSEEIQLIDRFSYASFVLLATVCYGITGNVLKQVVTRSKLDALSITSIALAITAIPYWIYFFASSFHLAFSAPGAWEAFAFIAILGLIGTAFATVVFNHLIKITDPIFASSVTYLVPIVALLWGIWDGEQMNYLQGLGMAIILVGVYGVTRK